MKRGRKPPAAKADFHVLDMHRYDGPFLNEVQCAELAGKLKGLRRRITEGRWGGWFVATTSEWRPGCEEAFLAAIRWVEMHRALPDKLAAQLERALRSKTAMRERPAMGLQDELLQFAQQLRKADDMLIATNLVRELSAPHQVEPAPVVAATKDGSPTAFDRAADALKKQQDPQITPRQIRLWHEKRRP